jgi:DNA-directed RNA polymerase subunit beta
MLEFHHLVDDKIHVRAIGPYSLFAHQPVGCWALEADRAADIVQELPSVKYVDVECRTKIYESLVEDENTLEAGTQAGLGVLTRQIRGHTQLEKKQRSNPQA